MSCLKAKSHSEIAKIDKLYSKNKSPQIYPSMQELGEERQSFGTGPGMTDGMFLLRQLVRNRRAS